MTTGKENAYSAILSKNKLPRPLLDGIVRRGPSVRELCVRMKMRHPPSDKMEADLTSSFVLYRCQRWTSEITEGNPFLVDLKVGPRSSRARKCHQSGPQRRDMLGSAIE
jgi:hypothetical protein